MSTQNIYFHREKEKYYLDTHLTWSYVTNKNTVFSMCINLDRRLYNELLPRSGNNESWLLYGSILFYSKIAILRLIFLCNRKL